MTDGDSLRRAILADPADDAPRLVYADWLTERGEDERAEFIRVQVEAYRWKNGTGGVWCFHDITMPKDCPACNIRRRELDLFVGHGAAWFGPAACLTPPNDRERLAAGNFRVVRRGFVRDLFWTAEHFLAHAESLFRAHPITSVRLTDRRPGRFGNTVRWYWTGQTPDTTYPAHTLPVAILGLAGGREVGGIHRGTKDWHSEAEAWAALSRACVSHGRQLAGLPALA